MKKTIVKLFSVALALCMMLSVGSVSAFAAEVDEETTNEPVIVGEYDALLSDCLDAGTPMPCDVANVRIRSYATYDEDDGVQVHVELYVPWYDFPKPEFTGMSGTVKVAMNSKTTTKAFFETADGDSTIETDVDTGVTGDSGDTGTVTVAGVATANNALLGGGAFSISYEIEIP